MLCSIHYSYLLPVLHVEGFWKLQARNRGVLFSFTGVKKHLSFGVILFEVVSFEDDRRRLFLRDCWMDLFGFDVEEWWMSLCHEFSSRSITLVLIIFDRNSVFVVFFLSPMYWMIDWVECKGKGMSQTVQWKSSYGMWMQPWQFFLDHGTSLQYSFIVRVLIAVLIMFTYICGPSFFLLACYIMLTMFNDDFVSNTPNISSPTNHRLRKREGERSPKHFNPLTPRSNL